MNGLYTLVSNHHYGIGAGWISDNLQIIIGTYKTAGIIIIFDAVGNLIWKVELHQSVMEANVEIGKTVDLFSLLLRFGHEKLNLQEKPIQVKKFYLSEIQIGIEDLTSDFLYFLDNMSEFSSEEQANYKQMIDDWKNSGDFVFWWINDYWCNSSGVIIAS